MLCNEKKTRRQMYMCWFHMKRRCTNKSDEQCKNYGGRGISVCERWMNSLDAFIEDMGVPECHLSIDRINNDGDYSPENCRWATPKIQCGNRRTNRCVRVGESIVLGRDLAMENGISLATFKSRLKAGMQVEQAASVKSRRIEIGVAVDIHRRCYLGESRVELAREYGVSQSAVSKIALGKTHGLKPLNKRRVVLDEDQRLIALERLINGESIREVSARFGVCENVIRKIKNGS